MTTAAASDYTPGLDLADLDLAEPTPAERAARLAAAGLDADPAAGTVTFVRAPRPVTPPPVRPAPAPAPAPTLVVDPMGAAGAVGLVAFLAALLGWIRGRGAVGYGCAWAWWVTYREAQGVGAPVSPAMLTAGVNLGLIPASAVPAAPPVAAPAVKAPAPAPVVEAPLVAPAAAAGVRLVPHPRGLGVETPFLRGPRGYEERDALKAVGAAWCRPHSSARPEKGEAGVWAFPVETLPRVRAILQRYRGTDGGPAPTVAAPATVAPVAPVAPAATPATEDAPTLPTGLEFLSGVVAEGAALAAQANTVRGGVSRADVNPVAGFNNGAGAAASFATAASAATFQPNGRQTPATPVTPSTTIPAGASTFTRPLAADVPEPLAAGIRAARERGRRATETEAQRAMRLAWEESRKARSALDAAITVALQTTDGEYPHGCLTGWGDFGVTAWSRLHAVAEAAGVRSPEPRSRRALASEAVAKAATAHGCKVKVVVRGSKWTVYRTAGADQVGASVGAAEAIATLVGHDLRLTGDVALCAAIRTIWQELCAAETLDSTAISAWLSGLLASWRAVATVYGRGWLAPGAPTERWRRLATELNAAGFPVPSRPAGIGSREDIADDLQRGLRTEVNNLISAIERQRAEAKARGEEARAAGKTDVATDLGDRGVVTATAEIAAVTDKIAMYECITGPMPAERARLTALKTELAGLLSDTTLRGMVLELD